MSYNVSRGMEENSLELGCPPPSEDPMAPYKLLNFVVIMTISAVGLIGNLLVILTFSRQKRKTSATTFLKNLAAFDMLLIITTNLFSHRYAYNIVFPLNIVNQYTAGKLTIGVLPISYMCQSFSTWTVVAVALDRYIHVCHPLKAMRWCKIRIANRIVIGITLFSIIYNIPRFFEYYKILEVARDAIDACTGYFHTPENTLGNDTVYQYSYAFGLYMVIMYAIPLGSLLFFNSKLIRKINSMSVPGMGGEVVKLKGSDKILPSLIGVVTIFMICQIPDMVLQILWRINSPFAPTFSIIAYDFVIINSSANFIIYVVAAAGFRRSLIANVLTCLQKISPIDDTTNSNMEAKWKLRTSYTTENSSKSQNEMPDYSKNWKQSYSNPTPIEEENESASDYQQEQGKQHEIIRPERVKTPPADVWIGGSRKPKPHEKEEPEGMPNETTLPDGSNLGVTGVFIVTQDPLLSASQHIYYGTSGRSTPV